MTQAVETKKMQDIVSSIETMSVLELADLVKVLEEKFGVTAAAPVAVAAAGGAAQGGGAAAEEKTSVTIILKSAGANKINVIKEIRTVTSLGLKEAKDLTDKPGSTVKEGVKKTDAEEIKSKLESAGATIELK